MHNIFAEITIVLILATALGLLMRALKQPTILGYIIAGVVAGPLGILRFESIEVLDALAQVGIATLLFLVGMEMRASEIKGVGKSAAITAIGQIVITSVLGYGLVRALGYDQLTSVYAAVALTFSSTIIVVKLLSEKQALETLYGKIVVGFLLIQDFVALGFLILLSSLRAAAPSSLAELPYADIAVSFGKGTAMFIIVLLVGKYLMPPLMQRVARSAELAYLVGLAWGMGLSALAASPLVGLSIEFGAFLAGIAVANTFERLEIGSRIKPIRDFFIVLFFVVLGSRLTIGDLSAIAFPALVLSTFVLVGNPLIVMAIMGVLGFRARTSFLASVTVAQISEFSLILVALGLRLGHFDDDVVTLITAVGMITIAGSSYLIQYAEPIYEHLRGPLSIFERRHPLEKASDRPKKRSNHVVLIGCKRTGPQILAALLKDGKKVTVVDIDPSVVQDLLDRGIDAVYGDATDPDIREEIGVHAAKTVISTMNDFPAQRDLVRHIRHTNKKTTIVCGADDVENGNALYAAGCTYVLMAHLTAGAMFADVIGHGMTARSLASLKKRDMSLLGSRG